MFSSRNKVSPWILRLISEKKKKEKKKESWSILKTTISVTRLCSKCIRCYFPFSPCFIIFLLQSYYLWRTAFSHITRILSCELVSPMRKVLTDINEEKDTYHWNFYRFSLTDMIDQRNSSLPRLHFLENSGPPTELFTILLLSREATFNWFSLSLHSLRENWSHSLSKQKSLIGAFRTSPWIMQPLFKVTNYIIFSISPYCREHDVFEAGLRSSLSSGLLFSFSRWEVPPKK